ncbi:MAG: ABC transporter permease, partial [Candidatus Omnitrophota bacterium]
MKNPIEAIGKTAIDLYLDTMAVVALFFNTIWWIVAGPFNGKPASRQSIFQQMVFAGVQSVVIVFFISFFTGIVIAMQSAYQLKELGAVIYVAPM